MRLALFVLLLPTPTLWSQSPDAIVQRAIQAHGGADALAKMKAVRVAAKGKVSLGGPDLEATREAKWALPDRVVWILEFPKEKIKTVIGVNGLSGWQQVNAGAATDLTPMAFDTMTDDAWAYWLATVLPLSGKDLTISAAPDAVVENQPVSAIKILKPGRPEATLNFSKSSGLLLRVQYKGREAGAAMLKEIVLSHHKEFERIKLPTRAVDIVGGQKKGEWQVTEYRFVDKFDAGTFKKP